MENYAKKVIAQIVSDYKSGDSYLCLWEKSGAVTYKDRQAYRAAIREPDKLTQHHACFALRRPIAGAQYDLRLIDLNAMKTFTIVVAEFRKSDSRFVLHVNANTQIDAERAAVNFADGETGCGPYEVLATFEGTPELLSFSACGIHEITVNSPDDYRTVRGNS